MRAEFSVAGSFASDTRSPTHWLLSHLGRYKLYVIGFVSGTVGHTLLNVSIPLLVGVAFNAILEDPPNKSRLTQVAIALFVIVLLRGGLDLGSQICAEIVAKRLERDGRDELYVNLLGKSQTFHNRQRVGDLMARAANDVRQLSLMVNPGLSLIIDSFTGLVVPIVAIAIMDWRLLPPPLFFTVFFLLALRRYMRQLNPASITMREQFGNLNAGLQEAISGIEVIKTTAQESQEKRKFLENATGYRNATVRQGEIQARYLPTLLLGITNAFALLLGLTMVSRDEMSIGTLVSYLGLVFLLRFPTFISIFSFSLVQLGVVSAGRIMTLIAEQTELDQNDEGYAQPMQGDIVFDTVTFTYGGEPVIENVSFHAAPGETVAIVGETGSGKSTLSKLVNRIYDLDSGSIRIDGVDVRDWNLDSLRSQISTIEQDIVLFSRPIHENIGFSLGQQADVESVYRAARDAQADQFIRELPEGYNTIIGERGVTLSGGQRQRLAIARALITDPSILIIDDSTSAVDSATEDQIQRAIHRVMDNRTTLLITHRLSQIRQADQILVLRKGKLVDSGTHQQLLKSSELYQRIFSHYDDIQDDSALAPAGPTSSS